MGSDLQCLKDDVLTSLDRRLSEMNASVSEALSSMGADVRRSGRRCDEVDARLQEALQQLQEELEQKTKALAASAERRAHSGLSDRVRELVESLRGVVQQVGGQQTESRAQLTWLQTARDGDCAAVGGRLDRLSSEVAELRAAAMATPVAPPVALEGYQELRQLMRESVELMREFERAHKELGRGLLVEVGMIWEDLARLQAQEGGTQLVAHRARCAAMVAACGLPESANESRGVAPAANRREDRRIRGFVTKKQLIAALSQDEDSEEEHCGMARQQRVRFGPEEIAAVAAARRALSPFPGLATLAAQPGPGGRSEAGAGSQASPLQEFLPTPGISTPGSIPHGTASFGGWQPPPAGASPSSARPWVWRDPLPPPALAEQLVVGSG